MDGSKIQANKPVILRRLSIWNCMQVRILDVVYNATSNELVRTKTLLKNAIVQIDGQPFKQW